jgi:riboflavin kinase
MRAPAGERPLLAGPDSGPEPPFPLRLSGPVIKGFGRGSKELQIPTANIPISGLSVGGCENVESGVYYGWASLNLPPSHPDYSPEGNIYPMVMSIGWNPFYKNEVRSVEVHIIHDFKADFYGVEMRLVILGYIRPEYDYVSREALIDDIKMDIRVGLESLKRPAYAAYRSDPYLYAFEEVGKGAGESTKKL